MKLTIFICFGFYICTIKAEWIDPHSMDTKPKHKMPHQQTPRTYTEYAVKCETIEKDYSSEIHLKRIIRLILNSANLENDMGYYEGRLNVRLSLDEYNMLVNFCDSTTIKSGDSVFSEVSSIFEDAFKKPLSDRYPELILSAQEKLYFLIVNPTSTALVGIFLTFYITSCLIRAQFTWKSIFTFFLIMAYIIDVAVTYATLVREHEIEGLVNVRQLGDVPPECNSSKMTWLDYLKAHFVSENACKKYYEATYPISSYVVAPSKILSRQFKTLIVEPFGDLGLAFGKFGRGLFTSLPFGLNLIIFPIMLIGILIMIFMGFLFTTKYHFKIGLFHLLNFEFRPNEQKKKSNREILQPSRKQIAHKPNRPKNKKMKNKEVGFTTHRKLVEEVSNKHCSSREASGSSHSKRDNKINDNGEKDISKDYQVESNISSTSVISDNVEDSSDLSLKSSENFEL